MPDPTCSIVICTDGRPAALAGVLRSLERLEGGPFEVVVVRGPTEDGIADVLRPWHGRIKILRNPVRNLSASRNIGIAASGGEVVAFVDDDGFPEPEWLTDLLAPFSEPPVAAAGGIVMDHTGLRPQYGHATCNRLGVADCGHAAPMNHLCVPAAFDFPYVQGTNSAFRRSDLLAIGGFDEEYEFFHDETDVCCRLVDAGRLIRQLPGAVVHHKMLPSDIRDAGRRINRLLPVLKNTLYFSLVNGRGLVSTERAGESFESRAEFFRRALAVRRERGEIDDAVVARFEADVLEAREVGWRRGMSRERRLMAATLVPKLRAAFLPLEAPRPAGGRRRLVFALTSDVGAAAHSPLPRRALVAAARGHHVHVVAGGAEADEVSFDGCTGTWIHRLARDAACLDASAGIVHEVERIAARRTVDGISVWRPRRPVARTPVTAPVEAPAPSSGRFMRHVVESLAPLLGGAPEVAVTTFPHHWNVGDSAIWAGTLRVLESLGVRVSYVCTHRTYAARDLRRQVPDGPILLAGGGNFGDVYEDEAGLRRRVLEDFPDRPVIQLPQSIWIRSTRGGDALRRLIDRHRTFTLLVRDRRSLETAGRLFAVPTALCPDMALTLEDDPRPTVRARRGIAAIRRRDGEALDPAVRLADADSAALPDWQRENATMRRDHWSQAGRLAWEVVEAWHAAGTSTAIPMRLVVEATAMLAVERTRAGQRLLCRGRAVVTDRLHAGLLAWLAGRPTVLVDNVDGKNRALAATWFAEDVRLRAVASWEEGLALAEGLAAEHHDDAVSAP